MLFVDSANVCLGEGLLVRLAVQLRAAGRTLVQIATDLEHAKEHLHLVAAIDDLKFLRKGGRISGGLRGRGLFVERLVPPDGIFFFCHIA